MRILKKFFIGFCVLIPVCVIAAAGSPASGVLNEIYVRSSDAKLPEDIETAEEIAAYFEENTGAVELLADAYNADAESLCSRSGRQAFSGKAAEFTYPVIVLPGEKNGYYIDFDGDCGYMVVTDGREVVAFEPSGELSYIRALVDECTVDLYYSIYDGFVYSDETETFVLCESRCAGQEGEVLLSARIPFKLDSRSVCQTAGSGGVGEIENPDSYIRDEYGSGYTVFESNHLDGFEYVTQASLSLYCKREGESLYSEGNCTLSSVYSMLNYLQRVGKFCGMPAGYEVELCNPERDLFYGKYKGNAMYYIRKACLLPCLYVTVRNCACREYGYETDGVEPSAVEGIIESVASEYGYRINAVSSVIPLFSLNIKKEIDEGKPVIWNFFQVRRTGAIHPPLPDTGCIGEHGNFSVFGLIGMLSLRN